MPKTEALHPSILAGDQGLQKLQDKLRIEYADSPLIIKPSVSASGLGTHLLRTPHDLSQEDVDHIRQLSSGTKSGSILLQEFLVDIQAQGGGEWSIVFIRGLCTHAALKRPREGEYRINSQFGGTFTVFEPGDPRVPLCALRLTDRLWKWLKEKDRALNGGQTGELLYARIDGIVAARDKFVLMEVELIEPHLALSEDGPGRIALDRLCDAIVRDN